MKLEFLGTGGGRYVTGMQRRRTGGIIVETDEVKIHVDPGPGALVYANKDYEDQDEIEGVIVSHAHPDHSSDAEAIIEMVTEAYKNPCYLFANETALKGYSDVEKRISDYQQDLCNRVETLEEEETFEFRDIEIESQEMFHGDPKTQGFTLYDGDQKIGFWTDTEFSEELLDLYSDCDLMVIYCTRPKGKPAKGHTSIKDIPEIMKANDASTCIITHFGYALLDSDLDKQKEWLKEEIDAKVIFADDGMKFPGNRTLGSF